jgi:F-type H+-transporting ATPase subunit epsilon
MNEQLMSLKVLIPFGVFAQIENVAKIILNTRECGSVCLLPHRLDCVAALSPGLLAYEEEGKNTNYLALDEGVMVKTGTDVLVSARNAFRGDNLTTLHQLVEKHFLHVSEDELKSRQTASKLEGVLLSRLMEFSHEQG